MGSVAETATTWATYQPVIIGLGAVVVGTLGNTLLEWFRHYVTDKRAASALRRSLLEELKHSKETVDLNKIRADEPDEGGQFIIPLQEKYRIYDQSIDKIGLLGADEIASVIGAYAMLYAQIETVSIMGKLYRVEGAVLQAVVDSKWAKVLSGQAENMSEALQKAIRTLEMHS
jgi:hypothetical protein